MLPGLSVFFRQTEAEAVVLVLRVGKLVHRINGLPCPASIEYSAREMGEAASSASKLTINATEQDHSVTRGFLGGWLSLDCRDDGRRRINHESVAYFFACQRIGRRVRRRIGCDDFDAVAAVGNHGGVKAVGLIL